jgi:hypothetical protein
MGKMQIDFSQESQKLVLDFQDYSLDVSQIAERVSEILPILEAVLLADIARADIREGRLLEFLPGILARDMIYQEALNSAARNADLVYEVTTEQKSIADLGFPDLPPPISQDD